MASNPHRNELEIRQATEGDCDALTALMLRSAAYQGRYRSMVAAYPVTPEMVREKGVWVAEQDGEIVGFYRLNLADADLDLMFVDDRAQGRGIGRSIFDHMKRVAADMGFRKVHIVAHPPAADFYRRMGAVDIGLSKAKNPEGWDRPILNLAVAE